MERSSYTHERVLALVAEVLADGAAGVGRDVEEGRGLAGGGGDHDGVVHGPEVLERLHHLGHRRPLLADGDVDADDVLALLVDDRVEGDRGLAGLAVADDQLALAAADGHHAVDGLDAGLQRLAHRLAVHDAGGDDLHGVELRGGHRALAVDGLAERVHDAADHGVAHGHGHDAAGALDLVAFLDLGVLAHEHDADRVLLEVQGDGHDAVRQLQQLARHAALEAVDARDAVAHGEHGAGLGDVHAGGEAAQLLADDLGDLFGPNVHAPPLMCSGRCRVPSVPGSGAAARGAAPAPSRRRSALPSSPACRPAAAGRRAP